MGKGKPLARILLTALLIVLTWSVPLSGESREDLTIELHPDGTVKLSGIAVVTEKTSKSITGRGTLSAYIGMNTDPVKIKVNGEGMFTLRDTPLPVKTLIFQAKSELASNGMTATLHVKAETPDPQAREPLTLNLTIIASVAPDKPEMGVFILVEPHVVARLEPTQVAMMNSMLGQLGNATTVNQMLEKKGLGFIKVQALDNKLRVSGEGVTGTLAIFFTIDGQELAKMVEEELIRQGTPAETAKRTSNDILEALKILGQPSNAGGTLLVEARLEGGALTYTVNADMAVPRDRAEAAKTLLETLVRATPSNPPAGAGQPLPTAKIRAPDITLAPKPLNATLRVEAGGGQVTLTIDVGEVWLTLPSNPGKSLETAIATANQLLRGDPSRAGETLDRMVIRLAPQALQQAQAKGLDLHPKPPLDQYATKTAPGELTIQNAPADQTYTITLAPAKQQATTQPTPTMTTPTKETKPPTTTKQTTTTPETTTSPNPPNNKTPETEKTTPQPRETTTTPQKETTTQPKQPQQTQENQTPKTTTLSNPSQLTIMIAAILLILIAIRLLRK